MSVPFREEETGALARAEALEVENQELREEIERLKDRVGENRDAYVANIENQLKALKSELADVKVKREWKPTLPALSGPQATPETKLLAGIIGLVILVIWLATYFFGR